jgi:hypothetical protein
MKRFTLILAAFALLISGCATVDTKRVDAWKAVALEEQKTEAAKWDSLKALGQGADPNTKDKLAMAWMAAAMSGGQKQPLQMPAEPESAFDKTLRALTILAPVAGNVALGVVQSQGAVKIAKYTTDTSARIAESRDKSETDRLIAAGKANVDIAGKIQAPPGTNNYIGGDGVIGNGTINKTNITTVNNCPTGDTGNATATPSGTTTPNATANGGATGATVCNGK